MKKSLISLGLIAGLVGSFLAIRAPARQTPILNPTQFTVTVPSNYDDTTDGTTKLVSSLVADVMDGATVARTTDVGHPNKDASNAVTVGFTQGTLVDGKVYTLIVRAVNSYGSNTASVPSDPFKWVSTNAGQPGKPKPCKGNGTGACP